MEEAEKERNEAKSTEEMLNMMVGPLEGMRHTMKAGYICRRRMRCLRRIFHRKVNLTRPFPSSSRLGAVLEVSAGREMRRRNAP